MAETRVQVAYHCKLDLAQLTPGAVRLPEMITRTVTVGDSFVTEKVALDTLPAADRAALLVEIESQMIEATRTARAVVPGAGAIAASDPEEELTAF